MENPSEDTSNSSTLPPKDDGELPLENAVVPDVVDHDVDEPKAESSEEEIKSTLEAIASTGKFWQEWEKIKGMLSFWMKQVISEYPEAKMTKEEQSASLGETYAELVSRLDEELLSFDEGPPFTLQRLCEILLAARSIYPKLSKLALALEKNLLVTSMLSMSRDPQSETMGKKSEEEREKEETKGGGNWVGNGGEAMEGDKDEIMTEVEEADVEDAMTIDMEAADEEAVGPSDTTQVLTKSND